MDAPLPELLALAFRSADARDANAAMAEVRAAGGEGGQPCRCYEAVVPEGADLAWLRDSLLPRLIYHLESVRARPPDLGGFLLALFAGEKLHFLRAADFLPAAARLAGTSVDELYARHGTRELRTAVKPGGPPLALPGKPE